METNRRLWLKKLGIGVAGIGLSNFNSFASPLVSENLINSFDNTNLIFLRSNENPYGPSPLARKSFVDNATISNRYNWDIAEQLISDLAKKNSVKDENILLGAGSTEILDLVAKFVTKEKGNYVIADPSYDYWTVTLDNLGLTKNTVPLTADKKINLQAMLEAVNQDTKLVYICNPNNPTGTICEREALLEIVTKISQKTLVLIDEAYLEFTKQQSISSIVNENKNIIITKTFSKIYGLAGARIGYAIAHKTIIDNLGNLQSNTNNSVSVLSKLAAIASLKDDKFVSNCYSLNENVRQYTISELKKLNCECISSNTNFIYFSLSNYKKDYFKQLENNNIEGGKIYEEQGKWTRITVGKMDEMKKFIKAIE
ncbi:histidinol-phosphate aminotransferase [Flavobacterium sp. 7E]|uniref:pyridoxal phosphate-dependent aminotransferase n=1 Tax=unclassified Flavobacterium TaxID=196869 RepID=UPI00156F8E74|nr:MULTISPECIES: aminotransferase class I/II-fold pyridoxal phosphate-dependent enzyme [unclassified Flavobacterium]MBE0390776.1 Histidinol-phosphate aminotransferase [Flavobacterium sp. PL002]NRS87196.1 histidinol-phosphate aminotransferase [Flavobacterium sp. 7E]